MRIARDHNQHPCAVPMPGATVAHLAALVAIAQERSLERAARRAGCSRRALSDQLSELESAAGLALVSRTPDAVELTAAGRRLLPHVETVLAHVEAARDDLAALPPPGLAYA